MAGLEAASGGRMLGIGVLWIGVLEVGEGVWLLSSSDALLPKNPLILFNMH